MITTCPYCEPNSAGEHAWNCPNRGTPRTSARGYSFVILEKPKNIEIIRQLRAEIKRMRDAIAEAIDNCETCHGINDESRRCARCQTFSAILYAGNDEIDLNKPCCLSTIPDDTLFA